jgi:isoamylase
VVGDQFGRTQGGNNNPYNQDNEMSWTDWDRRVEFATLETFVALLTAFCASKPVLSQPEPWGSDVEWFGTTGPPDLADHSRSIAWHVDGLYVMANMWWEPIDFTVQAPGPWRVAIDTTDERGIVDRDATPTVTAGPRSIVVLQTPTPS